MRATLKDFPLNNVCSTNYRQGTNMHFWMCMCSIFSILQLNLFDQFATTSDPAGCETTVCIYDAATRLIMRTGNRRIFFTDSGRSRQIPSSSRAGSGA